MGFKIKKIYSLFSIIIGSIVLNICLYSSNIIDVSTGEKINNISLQWPTIRLFIEPFYAFAYYILTMERSGYVFALISWLLWLVFITILLCKYNKINLKNSIVYSCFSFFFFISLCCSVIILPVIGPKITNVEGYKVLDAHSHTISSRDNISTIASSVNFHKKHGFTDFFITEHDNTNGYKTIPYNIETKHIFPGIQIRTTDGQSILLLSQYCFKYEDFKDRSIKEMISLAHAKDMLVIMPHWWKWKKPNLRQLVDWQIDGFEIYNCGYRYISNETRQLSRSASILKHSRKKRQRFCPRQRDKNCNPRRNVASRLQQLRPKQNLHPNMESPRRRRLVTRIRNHHPTNRPTTKAIHNKLHNSNNNHGRSPINPTNHIHQQTDPHPQKIQRLNQTQNPTTRAQARSNSPG